MNGLAVAGSVLGLGVAGLDPVGALMVVPAIAAGARRRLVVLFFASAGVFTVATGMVLGQSVQLLATWIERLAVPDVVRLIIQLVASLVLAIWAIRRWRTRRARRTTRSLLTHPASMLIAGVLWGVSAVTDPSFLALAAIESGLDGVVTSFAVYLGWFLVSQLPLTLIVIALAAGRQSRLLQRSLALAHRIAGPMSLLLTALLAACSVLLLLSSATVLVAGRFWPV